MKPLELMQSLFVILVLTSVASHVSAVYLVESGPKTAAQRLEGFSGNYGLGGNLGGLTLNDIGYDISDSFTEACHDIGINLGLSIDRNLNGYKYSQIVPKSYGTALDLSDVIATTKVDSDYDSDVLLTSGTAGYKSSPYKTSDKMSEYTEYLKTSPVYVSSGDARIPQKVQLIPKFSDTMTSAYAIESGRKPIYAIESGGAPTFAIKSDITPTYAIESSGTPAYAIKSDESPTYVIESGGKKSVSGYSAEIIHKEKNGKISGESRVTFTKLHTTPSKLIVAPDIIKRTISEPSVYNSYNDFSPFTYEYPGGYKTAITHKYGSQLTGGFGSHLTGSYGSMLTNGYRRVGLLSDGGLKGLKYSYVLK